MNISFIGFGNMAKAIAKGLLNNPEHHLKASAPSLKEGVNHQGIHTFSDNLSVIQEAEVIILAVKPVQMNPVINSIIPRVSDSTLIISVAAGMSLSWFFKRCNNHAVVRAMPNVGAAVGASATPLIANEFVNEAQKQTAEEIFKSIGLITWVQNESEMDAFTALSGSGPAYVYRFIEAMIGAGISLGLEQQTATQFALKTVEGALKTAQTSNMKLSELRKQVTSPGGTTAAALEVFETCKLDGMVLEAMKAAQNRAKELGCEITANK